jgi:hypothetical protein
MDKYTVMRIAIWAIALSVIFLAVIVLGELPTYVRCVRV